MRSSERRTKRAGHRTKADRGDSLGVARVGIGVVVRHCRGVSCPSRGKPLSVALAVSATAVGAVFGAELAKTTSTQ